MKKNPLDLVFERPPGTPPYIRQRKAHLCKYCNKSLTTHTPASPPAIRILSEVEYSEVVFCSNLIIPWYTNMYVPEAGISL